MDFISRYLEVALILIVLYLILTNFVGFATSLSAVGNLNTGAIKAFQGR